MHLQTLLQIINPVFVKKVELPVFNHRHRPEKRFKRSLLLLRNSVVYFTVQHRCLGCREDHKSLLSGSDLSETFLGVLVSKLCGTVVLKIILAHRILSTQFVILRGELLQCLFEENISVERKRKTKRHETYNRETHDNRKLLRDWFEVTVGHNTRVKHQAPSPKSQSNIQVRSIRSWDLDILSHCDYSHQYSLGTMPL